MKPDEIVRSTRLTLDEKAARLREWDNGLRELMAANDENMRGPVAPSVTLAEVAAAMRRLGIDHAEWAGPTKHG
ncbi:MAG: hypothetical protein AB1730_24140 [Myxococcota bacterium]|jgi:hypothetical protein